jgi:HK97 family phage prohead protease
MQKQVEIKEYKEIDDEVIEILASDESTDRDNDVIKADGWEFSGWLKSGSLLYGHDPSNLPIGSAEGARVTDGKLYLYSRLAKKGTSEWHDTIRSLLEQKILKGASVGFKPYEYENNEFGGRTFTKSELLEISLTPVPANINAQVILRGMDISDETKEMLIKKPESMEEEETLDVEPQETKEDKFLKLYNLMKKGVTHYE